MNRYVVDGLVREMRAGRRVLVVSDGMVAARSAMRDVAASLGDGETVRRTNGQEQVRSEQGGAIWFRSARSSLRGLSVDTVFDDTKTLTPELFAEMLLLTLCSDDPRLVRA